jgi:hypothetical protein
MFSLKLSGPGPDSASIDSSFLQLLICFCIIFQEFLFCLLFTVFQGLATFSAITVAAAYIKWFIFVISVSFSFKTSSIIYSIHFFLKPYYFIVLSILAASVFQTFVKASLCTTLFRVLPLTSLQVHAAVSSPKFLFSSSKCSSVAPIVLVCSSLNWSSVFIILLLLYNLLWNHAYYFTSHDGCESI